MLFLLSFKSDWKYFNIQYMMNIKRYNELTNSIAFIYQLKVCIKKRYQLQLSFL